MSAVYPALTGLKATGKEWKELAGVRMHGTVRMYIGGEFVKEDQGEIQLVKDGISGIPVFQLCRLAAEGLGNGDSVMCRLDFFPELSEEELLRWLHMHSTHTRSRILCK